MTLSNHGGPSGAKTVKGGQATEFHNVNSGEFMNELPRSLFTSSASASGSSRCSTPTPSTASSTDESMASIQTPTLEHYILPSLTFSPPIDDATRILLRDRYLESQRPIIISSSTNSLDISKSIFQEQKSEGSLFGVFTPPETPSTAPQKEALVLGQVLSPPKLQLDTTGDINVSAIDLENPAPEMGANGNTQLGDELQILVPDGSYELDNPNRPTKYGTGAWSNVYKGLFNSKSAEQPLLVAVKRPLNNISIPTLRREAMILTIVENKTALSSDHQSIVKFHGFDYSTNSLVLTAITGETLDDFVNTQRKDADNQTTMAARRLPVVGTTQWLFFCERLISACAFLKENGIIHGDLKPQNILTKPWEGIYGQGRYHWVDSREVVTLKEPIITDFSSSYVVGNDGKIPETEEPISAVTTIYCAPELLEAFRTPPSSPSRQKKESPQTTAAAGPSLVPPKKVHPRPFPTFASDLYALGITMAQAAIGSHPFIQSKNEMQRTMWIRQGDPIAFYRMDERTFRCKKNGIVDRLVLDCFGKDSSKRKSIEDIVVRISELTEEWRGRKGSQPWTWGD